MSTADCAEICERLYNESVSRFAGLAPSDESGRANTQLSQSLQDIERAFCTTAITSICKATFKKAVNNGGSANPDKILRFFKDDLGADWESLNEAKKVLADLTIDGDSMALNQDSGTMKAQFQSLCRPFLSVLTDISVPSSATVDND